MLEIHGKRRGTTTAKCRAQTRHGGTVSYSRLIFQVDDTQRTHQLTLEIISLIVHGRAAERGDGQRVVDTSMNFIASIILGIP